MRVPRDKVFEHARSLALLPRAEYVRMGGPECAIGAAPRDPNATMSRDMARALLGGIRFDLVHPLFGLHEAALRNDPLGEILNDYKDINTTKDAAKFRKRWITTYGDAELTKVLQSP